MTIYPSLCRKVGVSIYVKCLTCCNSIVFIVHQQGLGYCFCAFVFLILNQEFHFYEPMLLNMLISRKAWVLVRFKTLLKQKQIGSMGNVTYL